MPDTMAQRQRKILELLQLKPVLTTSEVIERLGVSAMTVHRDLKKLEAAGALVRTHGGITASSSSARESTPVDVCAMCARTVPERTAFRVHAPQRGYFSACCPHCGLALLERDLAVDLALAADFLFGRMVSASNATYVVGSAVTLCCEPGVLAFATLQDAERFRCGFGGETLDLTQTQAYLRNQMAHCADH
jgi:hypothetical protein